MFETYIKDYNEAVMEIDKEAALEVVENALANGVIPEDIVFKIVMPAVEDMMEHVLNDLDTNLAQHFMTAQIAAEITEKMLQKFTQPPEVIGRVIIGTVFGDLHSLGKRIVMGCLKSMMVDVIDLGVNVTAEEFVNAAIEQNAQVIAVSSMMMHTATGEEVTCGVIDDIKMVKWTPEQTRAEVKRLIEIGKPGGHFLFGSSLMPLELPEENIQAMIQAAFEFGSN